MKKLALLLFLIAGSINAQENYVFNETGLSPKETIVEFPGINQKDLYAKAMRFVKETYRSPEDVIVTTVENEMIRFTGADSDAFCFKALSIKNCTAAIYTVQLDFKDGKMKYMPVEIYYNTDSSRYSSGGRQFINLENGEEKLYRRNGKPRNMFEDLVQAIGEVFNLNEAALKDFIENQEELTSEW